MGTYYDYRDMTPTIEDIHADLNADPHGLAELSYGQLAAALAASVAKRRLYWAAFTAAAAMIAEGPMDELEECAAEMRGHLAAVEAQDAMTTAIITEIGRRSG